MDKNLRINDKLIEKIAYYLLVTLCALPVLVAVYAFIAGILGTLPGADEPRNDNFCYFAIINLHKLLFRLIGCGCLVVSVFLALGNINSLRKKENIINNPWFYILLIFLVWACVSTLLSDNPIAGLVGTQLNCDGLTSYILYGAIMLLATTVSSEKYKKNICNAFIMMVSIMCLIVLLQNTGSSFVKYCFPTLNAGIFENLNYFAYLLCTSIMLIIGRLAFDEEISKKKTITYAVLLLQFIVLLINGTLGAIIAVAVMLPVVVGMIKLSGKRVSIFVITAFLLLIVIGMVNFSGCLKNFSGLSNDLPSLSDDIVSITTDTEDSGAAGTGRWGLWMDAIDKIKLRPLFGYGPESFTPPHNAILQLAAFLGIPAMILFVLAIITIVVKLICIRKELTCTTWVIACGLGCYIVSAMFGHELFSTTVYFFMLLGMAIPSAGEKPLLLDRNSAQAEGDRIKDRIAIGIITLVFLLLFGGFVFASNSDLEKNKELADLQGMRCAEISAMRLLADGEVNTETTFWFDLNNLWLVPYTEPAPKSFGMGTTKKGGALTDFEAEYKLKFDYSEDEDYTDKVLAVTIRPSDKSIVIFWVEVK